MARRLVVSGQARSDIRSHTAWLSQPGAGRVATRKIGAIRRAIQALRTDPLRWPLGAVAGYRERVVEGYAIVYQVDSDTGDGRTAGDVTVARVFGPGQDRSAPVSAARFR